MHNKLVLDNFRRLLVKHSFPSKQIHAQVKNRNTSERCRICSKLTIMKPEWRHWRHSDIFILIFKHLSHVYLAFLLLTLNKFKWVLMGASHLKILRKLKVKVHFVNSSLQMWITTQLPFTRSKSTIENLEVFNMFKFNNKNSKTTSAMLFWCFYCQLWA